jgi:uncharacterized membrane protein
MTWTFYAILSAFFGALVAIFGKIGVRDVDSNLAVAIRTVIIVFFAWAIVALQGNAADLFRISRHSFMFLFLSAIATGLSWLFYYQALQLGEGTAGMLVSALVHYPSRAAEKVSAITDTLFRLWSHAHIEVRGHRFRNCELRLPWIMDDGPDPSDYEPPDLLNQTLRITNHRILKPGELSTPASNNLFLSSYLIWTTPRHSAFGGSGVARLYEKLIPALLTYRHRPQRGEIRAGHSRNGFERATIPRGG